MMNFIAWLLMLQPGYELQAVTTDGNMYVAGSGSSCEAAWKGAVIPANWRTLECVPVFLPRK